MRVREGRWKPSGESLPLGTELRSKLAVPLPFIYESKYVYFSAALLPRTAPLYRCVDIISEAERETQYLIPRFPGLFPVDCEVASRRRVLAGVGQASPRGSGLCTGAWHRV